MAGGKEDYINFLSCCGLPPHRHGDKRGRNVLCRSLRLAAFETFTKNSARPLKDRQSGDIPQKEIILQTTEIDGRIGCMLPTFRQNGVTWS